MHACKQHLILSIFYFKYKTIQKAECYSGLVKEQRQKCRLGTVSNRLLGWGGAGLKLVLLDSNLCPLLLQWFETFGESTQETNETLIRPMLNQR